MSSDNQIRTHFDKITKTINEDLKDFTPLTSTCKNYGQQPGHVVLILMAVILIMTIFGLFQHIMVTIFGLVYPAYMSCKSIKAGDEDNNRVWLTYWIVFGIVTAFDKLLSYLLFFIPGYYFLKVLFFAWMFYPRTNGAQVIYENLLKPQLSKIREYTDKNKIL